MDTLQLTTDGIKTIQKVYDDAHLYPTPGYDRNVDGQIGDETTAAAGVFADALREKTFVVHTGPISSSDAPAVIAPAAPGLAPLAAAIIAEANRFAGLHETVDNAAWDGTMPGHLLIAQELKANLIKYSGWSEGEAYCAAFGKMVLAVAYGLVGRGGDFAAINSLLNLSVVASADHLRDKGLLTHAFAPGCLIFFAHGNTGQGHMAIGRFQADGVTHTTEANTSASSLDSGSGQYEGDGVYEKTRTIVNGVANGMTLLGYFVPV